MAEHARFRVLIVDDDPSIRTLLSAYARSDGLEPVEASTAAECLRLVDEDQPDVVLLDLGLPDAGGLEVLAHLRAHNDLPVILVTARSEEIDKLVGLSVGADDYITKPFSPREVMARLRAVLRRSQRPPAAVAAGRAAQGSGSDERLVFDDLVIDEAAREVHLGGRQIELSALEFDILAALARQPGRVFSRGQLLDQVWGVDFFGDERVVDVHIRSIRAALGDDAAHPNIIGTVRGVGYKFLRRTP